MIRDGNYRTDFIYQLDITEFKCNLSNSFYIAIIIELSLSLSSYYYYKLLFSSSLFTCNAILFIFCNLFGSFQTYLNLNSVYF